MVNEWKKKKARMNGVSEQPHGASAALTAI